MDIDPIKAITLISGILTALDKLYTYGKSAYEYFKKIFAPPQLTFIPKQLASLELQD
jgi:hypothetical protein